MALAQESSDPLVDKIVEKILSGQAYLPRDHPERQRYPFTEGRRKITCIICPHPGELRRLAKAFSLNAPRWLARMQRLRCKFNRAREVRIFVPRFFGSTRARHNFQDGRTCIGSFIGFDVLHRR